MAITTEGGSATGRQAFAQESGLNAAFRVAAVPWRWALRSTALAALGLLSNLAAAQGLKAEFAVGSNVTVTDNAALTSNDQAESDVILGVTPQLSFNAQGARYKAQGSIGLAVTRYVEGTQRNRILPAISANLNAALIERWLFLDAGADLTTIEANSFGVQGSENSTTNRRIAETYRISPYIDRELSRELSLSARTDNQWTRLPADEFTGTADVQSRDVYVQRNSLVLEHRPVPIGGAVELSGQRTRYKGDADALLQVEGARAVVSAAFGGDVVISVVAGRERSQFSFTEESDDVYGLRLRWDPSPRTELDLAVEDRFFGKGVEFSFIHRNPQASFSFELSRVPVAEPVFLGGAPGGTNLAAFLDQILTTRIPDPVERGGAVRDLLRSRGLPDTLSGPISIVAQYAQLQETGNATLVLLGRRNTLTMSVFAARLERLVRPGVPDIGAISQDSEQLGGSIGFNRRLTPLTAADLSIAWSRIKGLADRAGDRTRQVSYQLGMTRRLGLRTNLRLGVSRREATIATDERSSVDETAAFAGLSHQF